MTTKKKSSQVVLFLVSLMVFLLGMPGWSLSAPPGIETFWNGLGVATWTTNAANPFTALEHWVKIVDYNGIAGDGSSHSVTVTYPNGGPTKTLVFRYKYDQFSAAYEHYDNSVPQPIDPDTYNGVYTYRVTRLSGEEEWSEATDELIVDPVPPLDETTFSPGLTAPEFILASFDDVYVNGALYDDFESGFDSQKWNWQPPEVVSYETQKVPAGTITVDGDGSEWSSLIPSLVDPEGDSAGEPSADIKSVYVAMDDTYAYVMVETYGKPIDPNAPIEINFKYAPFALLHTNILASTLFAWKNHDLEGIQHEPYPISGYTVVRGAVTEARIPLSEIENAQYFNPTYVNIWPGTPGIGVDHSPIGQPIIGEVHFEKAYPTATGSTWMNIKNPVGVNHLKAKVRVDSISGVFSSARIGGHFSRTNEGNVWTTLKLEGGVAHYNVAVEKWEGDHLLNLPLLGKTVLGSVSQGNEYDLSIEWDEGNSTLTYKVFGLNDSVDYTGSFQVTDSVGPPTNPSFGIGIMCWLRVDTTTPVFNWVPVDGANYYRVRIYGLNNNTIYMGYTKAPPFRLPPGVLKPDAGYRYRIEALKDHQWFEWDNAAASDRNKTPFWVDTSEMAQDPYIDLWSIGVETWNLESAEPFTSFYLKVHDAQGVPGNVESVKVTLPDGLTQLNLYPDFNETPTCAVYRALSFGVPIAGNYVFTVVDRDGNTASAEEELTPNPIGYPSTVSISPAHNAVIGGTGVSFAWEEVPGAAFYQVNIYDKDMKKLFDFKTTGTSYDLPPGILQDSTLYKYNIHTRREFFESNADNGSESPRTMLQNGFFTTSKSGDGNNKPSLSLGGYGATVFHGPHPVTGEAIFNLEFGVRVDDEDGVPENIALVEVTYPLGQKRTLYYYDAPSWGFNYFYDEWHSEPSSIQAGTYTFRVVDFEGNEATIEDTLSDVSAGILPWPTGSMIPDGTILDNVTPTIHWDPVQGASYYKVRIVKPWGSATIYWSPELTQTSYTIPHQILSPNSAYAYRVYAYREPVGEDVDFYSTHVWWHGANPRFFTGQPGPSGWISGEVTTGVTGETTAIVGATVTIVETGRTTSSDGDGAFVFTSVPIGTYTLRIEKDGFETIVLSGIQVIDGQTAIAPASEMAIAQASPGLPGDANDDGVLGLDDVIYILQVLSGSR